MVKIDDRITSEIKFDSPGIIGGGGGMNRLLKQGSNQLYALERVVTH